MSAPAVPWSPFVLLMLSLQVSALAFLFTDNRQQEIRLAVLEKETVLWQQQTTKRLDLVTKRLLTLAGAFDARPPQQLYEEDGP